MNDKMHNAIQLISDDMGDNQRANMNVICCDCGIGFPIKLERISPVSLEYSNGQIGYRKREDDLMFKCLDCQERNPNPGPEIEIYSRVVGYMRPVQSWNDAKRCEFDLRATHGKENVKEFTQD